MKNTVEEFFDNLDGLKRTPNGTVIIHPGFAYGFVEVTEEFLTELKAEMKKSLMLKQAGLEEIPASIKFSVMVLDNCY